MRNYWKQHGENIYYSALTAEILSHLVPWGWMHYVTKPLLMPLLMVWLLSSVPLRTPTGVHLQLRSLLVAALIFAWLGDVLLLFAADRMALFAGGLLAFLTTHMLYIYFFVRAGARPLAHIRRFIPLLVALAMYLAGFLGLLWPYLGMLQVPVVVYALVIATMGYVVYTTRFLYSLKAYKLFVLGAFLFIVSDSILAFNKFHTALPIGSIQIMLTYGLAQAFIVKGFITHYASAGFADAGPAPEV